MIATIDDRSVGALFRKYYGKFKWYCESILARHPFFYFHTKRLVPYLPFLLPHDKDFLGFKHLAFSDEGLFLDVGANDGISALSFRHVNKKYSILSIEPNQYHNERLTWLKKKDSKFDFMHLAAGVERTTMTLYTPSYKGYPLHSACSLSMDQIRHTLATAYPKKVADNAKVTSQSVPVMPLDDLNLNPQIIKIDAEGFDHIVLKGLVKTIERTRPSIMIEHTKDTADQICNFFKERDYVVLQYDYNQDMFSNYSSTQSRNIFGISKNKLPQLKRYQSA